MNDFTYNRKETCCNCKIGRKARLVRDIATNGAINIYWLCTNCLKPFYPGKQFIKHEKVIDFGIDIDELLVIEDYSANGEPCAVCGKRQTEIHHFAPKHLFGDDADKWPVAPLCKYHHTMWHEILTPRMCEHDNL